MHISSDTKGQHSLLGEKNRDFEEVQRSLQYFEIFSQKKIFFFFFFLIERWV